MPEQRNIFLDDKKLLHLCEDFLHQREEMQQKAKIDPEQTPTATRLIEVLRYEDDETPLTMEEFMELQAFIEGDFADWHKALILTGGIAMAGGQGVEILNLDGTKKTSFLDIGY